MQEFAKHIPQFAEVSSSAKDSTQTQPTVLHVCCNHVWPMHLTGFVTFNLSDVQKALCKIEVSKGSQFEI